ncbi:hypothetical protein LEAN103870_01345 [Legionella anisa]|uniref:Uncharacterized protein n=1 Tax=Legionella anisa TaxID=28082 RepID=A0AAX0WQQ9_9GAMM|nr:hypothetical protein [Legionella anisa]AWN75447.1 hypothetical protein DLD14_17270 [Legionella anisa]KTC72821.1 hypothetical protein Lani_1045 [Legionella anisa]MBN5934559.1 hypothetical protein [Legionella anisa]MCW8424368.1 hypothetical protein [Legionella anisa]MCW8446514.1 hypothetical protein [Legionella anisa]
MTADVAMQTFVSEYIKDFAEEKWIKGINNYEDYNALYNEYKTALREVKKGNTYKMTHLHIDEEVVFTPEDQAEIEREIKKLDVAFDVNRALPFIMDAHPDYTFSDGQQMTEQFVRAFLKDGLLFHENNSAVIKAEKPAPSSDQLMLLLLGNKKKENIEMIQLPQDKEKEIAEEEINPEPPIQDDDQESEHSSKFN